MPSQLPLPIQLDDNASFENFYHEGNEATLNYLKNRSTDKASSLIYLWGDEKSGCTHLLRACTHAFKTSGRGQIYLPLDTLKGFSPAILDDLEQLDLICLDHLDSIIGLANWEEKLFYLYNRCNEQTTNSARTLIISAHLPAKQLKCQLPDLHSRLTAMLSLKVNPLNDIQKIKAIKKRAALRGLTLSDSVITFLLKRYPRDLETLFTILDQLDRASLAFKRKITIPLIKEILP